MLMYETPPDPGCAGPPAAGYATRSAACLPVAGVAQLPAG